MEYKELIEFIKSITDSVNLNFDSIEYVFIDDSFKDIYCGFDPHVYRRRYFVISKEFKMIICFDGNFKVESIKLNTLECDFELIKVK